MAYAESIVGGNYGSDFRIWVNAIRTYSGTASENYEDWRVEGGLNRVVSGPRIWNMNGTASYSVQLGQNGLAVSGNFNYDFTGGTGRMVAWGTATTRVNRQTSGAGFDFESRTDINLANSPHLTSGWVEALNTVETKYRQAVITGLTGSFYDTDDPWVEFTTPASGTISAWFELPNLTGTTAYAEVSNITSRYTWSLTDAQRNQLRVAMKNVNSTTVRYVVNTYFDGTVLTDYRDATLTIDNRNGIANPIFSNFAYNDTKAETTAVTANNQVLIQGRSVFDVKVPVADRAVGNKGADIVSYTISFGPYSESAAYSTTADIVKTISLLYSDTNTLHQVVGDQPLSIRAVDTRGNATTVTKTVSVLTYGDGAFFYKALKVRYKNQFDDTEGLVVLLQPGNKIAKVPPLTYNGTDLNTVNALNGLQYQIQKTPILTNETAWVDVPITQEAGTGEIIIDPVALATSIHDKMKLIGVDTTVPWYMWFRLTDEIRGANVFPVVDSGRPIFRIGVDSKVYNNEKRILTTDDQITPYAQGPIVANTEAGYRVFALESIQGIDTAGSTALVVTNPGVYYIHWWQLINQGTGANGFLNGYYRFIKAKRNPDGTITNPVEVVYGYIIPGKMREIGASWTGPLVAEDVVRLELTVPVFEIWSGAHSHFSMFRVATR